MKIGLIIQLPHSQLILLRDLLSLFYYCSYLFDFFIIVNFELNNFNFIHLEIKIDSVIVIVVAFLVTSIHVETILNTHHFITCVHLHIGINSN